MESTAQALGATGGAFAVVSLLLAGRKGLVNDSRGAAAASLFAQLAVAAIAFYAALGFEWGQVLAPCSGGTGQEAPAPRKARLYIPVVRDGHLMHVKESFVNAGYEITKDGNDTWDVMWSYHSPFSLREGQPDITTPLQTLSSKQRVNQFPGAAAFASKSQLAKIAGRYSFMPHTFVIPTEYEEFKEFRAQSPDNPWLVKSAKHRGVERVDPDALDLDNITEPILLQEAVAKPFLIDGKFFDAGFYVAITSVNPLRVYMYDDLLIRAAPLDYTGDVDAPRNSYVVGDDYLPPWQMPSLRKYYTWGMSTMNVLKAHVAERGYDPRVMVENVAAAAAEMLVHMEPQIVKAASRYPHGTKSFMALYRMDVILDEDMQPHVIEVNQSPNLSSAHFKDLANMFRRISTAFIRLAGLHRGGLLHPDTPAELEELMLHTSHIDIGYDVCGACVDTCRGECVVCRRCRVPAQSQMLKEAFHEHANQEGFLRIFPGTQRFPRNKELKTEGNNNLLLRTWLDLKCRDDPTWC